MNQKIEEFLAWTTEKNRIYHRFNELATIFENYISDSILTCGNDAKVAAERFADMLGKCNELSIYDQPMAADVYTMLHLLDRYYRLMRVYELTIAQCAFPLNKKIKILDIGTGPAPALFALSDITLFIKEYSKKEGYNDLTLDIIPDYVEDSYSFRNWLHHFTEYANCKSYNGYWSVPYHHGSFSSFDELDFVKLNYNKAEWQDEQIYKKY